MGKYGRLGQFPPPFQFSRPHQWVTNFFILVSFLSTLSLLKVGALHPCERKRQTACKPGSVRTRKCGTTIPLGRTSRCASRDQPGRQSGNAPAPCDATIPIRSCSRWGLPCRSCCQARGALLPPRFALARGLSRDACAGGVFSVALSLGSPPPAVNRHRIPVEPGLSSTAHAAAAVQPSGGTDMYDPIPPVKHATNIPLPRSGGG